VCCGVVSPCISTFAAAAMVAVAIMKTDKTNFMGFLPVCGKNAYLLMTHIKHFGDCTSLQRLTYLKKSVFIIVVEVMFCIVP
jgi:hypothetical protein